MVLQFLTSGTAPGCLINCVLYNQFPFILPAAIFCLICQFSPLPKVTLHTVVQIIACGFLSVNKSVVYMLITCTVTYFSYVVSAALCSIYIENSYYLYRALFGALILPLGNIMHFS